MTAFRAAFRYELRMHLRKRSLWITMAALALLTVLVSAGNIGKVFAQPDAGTAMVFAGQLVMLLLPVGFGALAADRLVRDEQLNVRPVLEATPAGPVARLGGKYLGACLAGGLPIIGTYLVIALVYVAQRGDPAALGHALVMAGTVLTPALLFAGAFALLCPLVMPAPLFRVLFTGYWFWVHLVTPAVIPTLNRTLLTPVNGYVIDVLLRPVHRDPAGPVPGAAFNVLRPEATVTTAVLSITLLLALAVAALACARAVLARSAR